jgi:hypothetical protein
MPLLNLFGAEDSSQEVFLNYFDLWHHNWNKISASHGVSFEADSTGLVNLLLNQSTSPSKHPAAQL